MARSASTWSRTKPPRLGRDGVGYVLVTTSTRIRRERIRARAGRIVTRPSLDCHSQVWFRNAPRGTIAEHGFPTMEEAPMNRLFDAPLSRLAGAPASRPLGAPIV